MDNCKQALTDLLVKIEAGEFDARTYPLMKLPQMSMNTFDNIHAAYNGSLDAAMAMHEAVLPDGYWALIETPSFVSIYDKHGSPEHSAAKSVANNPDPARAWLIAIIKALIAEADA